mmetsp:Transcript_48791/g.129321  ORF Transcript_48791/g.129321 Transcript_48791/m.129321 type:complete len:217 (-) Transcript_48791:202-852(-)
MVELSHGRLHGQIAGHANKHSVRDDQCDHRELKEPSFHEIVHLDAQLPLTGAIFGQSNDAARESVKEARLLAVQIGLRLRDAKVLSEFFPHLGGSGTARKARPPLPVQGRRVCNNLSEILKPRRVLRGQGTEVSHRPRLSTRRRAFLSLLLRFPSTAGWGNRIAIGVLWVEGSFNNGPNNLAVLHEGLCQVPALRIARFLLPLRKTLDNVQHDLLL